MFILEGFILPTVLPTQAALDKKQERGSGMGH